MPVPTSQTSLAWALLILLALSLAGLFFVNIPADNRDLTIALISGVIGAGVKDMVSWYFGSSKGSAAKDAVIASQADAMSKSIGAGDGDTPPPPPQASGPI